MESQKKKINVAILMGGPSAEHDISFKTGENIMRSLDAEKYNLKPVVITKDGKWQIPRGYLSLPEGGQSPLEGTVPPRPEVILLEERTAITYMKEQKTIDVVFIAMHGPYGEDGSIQGLLEIAGIPYTGSGVRASSLGMYKPSSAAIFQDHGMLVPDFITIKRHEHAYRDAIIKDFGIPLVVKPTNQGSSVGVHIVTTKEEFDDACDNAFRYSDEIMIQRYIKGREITCGILDDGLDSYTPLPPTEIIPKEKQFFDYYSKYNAEATDEITPPKLPKDTITAIQETALKAHKILGCSGFSRTDMILGDDGKLWTLEINTIPGLTKESIIPKEAAVLGIDFPELLDRIIESVLH